MTMPTDPLAEQKPGARPTTGAHPGGARPSSHTGPERRGPARATGYTGPERREPEGPRQVLGMPRWLFFSAAVYLALLALALIVIFTA